MRKNNIEIEEDNFGEDKDDVSCKEDINKYLYMDSDIDAMLLNGIIVNLAYEQYGEMLIKDAKEILNGLSPEDKRFIVSAKIRYPNKYLLDIIDKVKSMKYGNEK